MLAGPLLLTGALAGIAPAGASASSCFAWTGFQPPSPGAFNVLNGAAALSSCNAWAVGDYGPDRVHTRTLIEHWNGSAWTQLPSPSPAGIYVALNGVVVTSSADAWAVGAYVNSAGRALTLIEHWNGKAWTQVTSPDPGSIANVLEGVTATTSRNAWAVGFYNAASRRPLIEHWNGKTWTHVRSPDPNGPDALLSVAATSSRNAWAVGDDNSNDGTLILHWNGKAWKHLSSPGANHGDFLDSVTATSSGNAWAVGQQTGNSGLILHWNGKTWRRVTIPGPPFAAEMLNGVAGRTFRNAWAVGTSSTVIAQTYVLHWNGKAWRHVPTPSLNFGILTSVAATASGSLWAVGGYGGAGIQDQGALALHCC